MSGLEDRLGENELRELVRSLLWQYRVADAFWFLRTEERFGQQVAEELNAEVWAKAGQLAARDIRKRFPVARAGLEGFVQALEYYPWKMMDSFQVEHQGEQVLIWSTDCPPQVSRLKHGLQEYSCKEMHRREFEGFASEIDPGIKVHCEFAPPDPHPEDMFCKWRIYISPQD